MAVLDLTRPQPRGLASPDTRTRQAGDRPSSSTRSRERTAGLLAAIAALAALAAPADAAAAERATTARRPPLVGAPPSLSVRPATPAATRAAARVRTVARALQRSHVARRAVALGAEACADGTDALCGTAMLPLDWRHPGRSRRIPIAFQLFVHTGADWSGSAIWWNGGGPGPRTTSNEVPAAEFLFGPLRDRFDILLTDVRGTGASAIDCPGMQLFDGYLPSAAFASATSACAAQVGEDGRFYGSASSARDLEAIRAALGIPRLDIVGNSYGGMPAAAYAVRFPRRTRSVILSSAVDPRKTLRSLLSTSARGTARITDLLCSRSPACSAGIPDARAAVAAGVAQLRAAPVEGLSASASSPEPRPVRLTEGALFTLLFESDSAAFLSSLGEVPAAMIALGRGDRAPALRLAADLADIQTQVGADMPPPSDFSFGGYSAISCADHRKPWPEGLTPAARLAAAVEVARDVPLGPWRGGAIVRDRAFRDWQWLISCYAWSDVEAPPAAPRDLGFPTVPTLLLTTDYDTRVPLEEVRRTARRWPSAQLLDIGGGLHGAAFWACGPDRVRAFLASPGTPQEPCAPGDFPSYRAVGDFPETAGEARPLAVASVADETTVAERRMAAVALAAALDANSVTTRQSVLSDGSGLRGGTFEASADDTRFRIVFHGLRFASDVAVDGEMVYPWDQTVTPQTIDLTFAADDGTTGDLHTVGEWAQGRSADAARFLHVTGTINGHAVSLRLPL